LKEGSSGRASANASLVSSSTFNATHEVRITRQLEDNPKFSGANDVLRCRATFTEHQPCVGVLVYALEQMQTLGSLEEYNLFWDNCWAFARTLFRKFALDEAYPTMVEIRNTDGNMASANTEALDAYLGRLMYEDVCVAVGAGVGGVAGMAVGGTAMGSSVVTTAAATIGLASGPVGWFAMAGVLALGSAGTAVGCSWLGTLLGARCGSFVHTKVWEPEFTSKWRKVCDGIRLPHGALWHVHGRTSSGWSPDLGFHPAPSGIPCRRGMENKNCIRGVTPPGGPDPPSPNAAILYLPTNA
jgi:hypothetical protein